MMDILTEFMPHKVCLNNDPFLIFLWVIGNGLIALAYFIIPVVILYQNRVIHGHKIIKSVNILFALFILLCGMTHVFTIVTTFYGFYIVSIILGILTGLVSLFTAFVIIRFVVMRKPMIILETDVP